MKHIILDFMHIYYKYMFTAKSGRLGVLSVKRGDNGWESIMEYYKRACKSLEMEADNIYSYDITLIYHVLRDIESIHRRSYSETALSVCFDGRPKKKEQFEEYKLARVSKLGEDDILNIYMIREILTDIGYNIYYVDDLEADDLIYNLVKKYSDSFDTVDIYTNDADLMACINSAKITIYRRKQKVGYVGANVGNFEESTEMDFKTTVKYNAVMLFKSTCGDKSDGIAGIHKFGVSAFQQLVKTMESEGVDFNKMVDPNYTEEVIKKTSGITEEKKKEALRSLEMVRFINADIEEPKINKDVENNKNIYGKIGFNSLCK